MSKHVFTQVSQSNHVKYAVLAVIFSASLINLSKAIWIDAKAYLAQQLIASAWEETLESGGNVHKPWSWSDTWPIARLQVPHLNVDWIVLEGTSGQALAFGPGGITTNKISNKSMAPTHSYHFAGANINETRVIAGHKDTHFSFLEDLKHSDVLQIQTKDGAWHKYTVTKLEITEPIDQKISINTSVNELTLVTCYPFQATVTPSKLRYVVTLKKISNHA